MLYFTDPNSALRLELVLNNSFNSKNTLYEVLNHCTTVGGQRRLRSSILQPSSDIQLIHNRQEAVEEILSNQEQDLTLLKVPIGICCICSVSSTFDFKLIIIKHLVITVF